MQNFVNKIEINGQGDSVQNLMNNRKISGQEDIPDGR